MTITRVGLQVPENITLIESRMANFVREELVAREVMREAVKGMKNEFAVIDLPFYDHVKGAGVGFTFQITETLKNTYEHITLMEVDCKQWGAPLAYKRLFVIGSHHTLFPVTLRKITTVKDWDPSILYHSTLGLQFHKVKVGLISSTTGVVQSHLAAFGSPDNYALAKPLVARQAGGSYNLAAITPTEWSDLFGVELLTDAPLFQRIVPTKVINAVCEYLNKPVPVVEPEPEK